MAFGQFTYLAKQQSETPENLIKTPEKAVVLVVDDDPRILQGLELNLREKYTVRVCANAHEVMKQVDQAVRTVILDIKMPGKTGFEVYHEIKAQFPDLPIIFYSAYQSVMEAIKIRQEYKPFNYFVKGGNVQELLECVDRAVEHYGYCLQSIDLQKRFYAALSR